jgi:hypothetical protein
MAGSQRYVRYVVFALFVSNAGVIAAIESLC